MECHKVVCEKCDMHYCKEFNSPTCPSIKGESGGMYHPQLVENKKSNPMEQKVEKVLVEAATKYLAMGFSVIPVGRDKKPVGSWKEFQSKPM